MPTTDTKVAHTPGPWNWDGKFTVTITDVEGVSAAFRARSEDARLIAAAPELLAALKDMVAIYDGVRDILICKTVIDKLARADAAIVKAEGAK